MNIPSKTPALRLQDAPDPSTVPINDLSKLKAQGSFTRFVAIRAQACQLFI